MYVDGHHPANGDGHSARYKVIPKIFFVICHDEEARSWGKMANEGQKGEGVVKKKENEKKR